MFRCRGCKIASYCCRAHAKSDWKTHKAMCREMQAKPDSRQLQRSQSLVKDFGQSMAVYMEKTFKPSDMPETGEIYRATKQGNNFYRNISTYPRVFYGRVLNRCKRSYAKRGSPQRLPQTGVRKPPERGNGVCVVFNPDQSPRYRKRKDLVRIDRDLFCIIELFLFLINESIISGYSI